MRWWAILIATGSLLAGLHQSGCGGGGRSLGAAGRGGLGGGTAGSNGTAGARGTGGTAGAQGTGGTAGAAGVQVVLELVAGNIGGPGNVNGTGAAARFYYPNGVAVDGDGNVYVADTGNGAIRKVTAAGVVTTLATVPSSTLRGLAVDGAGNVYVADNNSGIVKVTAAGVVTLAGFVRGVGDGSAEATDSGVSFKELSGVAIDGAGNLYVADAGSYTIRKVNAAGVEITLAGSWGMWGRADGTGADARFSRPEGLAVDSAGNVFVADEGTIRKVTATGVVTTLAGSAGMPGSADGTGAAARFYSPHGLAIDSAGNVYVADNYDDTIRKVTAAGVVTTLAGTPGMQGGADGTGAAARLYSPHGLAIDSAGNLYVADTNSHAIRKVTAAGVVTTLAGAATMPGSADGTGAAARFNSSKGVTVDTAGNFYIADNANHTIRKITAAGVVTTLAGSAGMLGSADGTGAAARFSFPKSIAVDSAGNVYVTDAKHTIRKITAAGEVTTLAGSAGMQGSADGTGAAARFRFPEGVAVDGAGNVYVADIYNDTIRKITAAGEVTTLAGSAGMQGSADGTGAAARFFWPQGVAVDSAGNVYVADNYNNTIRKVTAVGEVTTLAGSAGMEGSADGTGAAARFSFPNGVAVDGAGNVYVAEASNHTIRKVTAAGVTTTIAGTPGAVGSIILGSTPGLALPIGLAVVGDSLAIVDTNAVLLLRHGAQ